MKHFFFILTFVLAISSFLFGQEHRFWNEIREFQKEDSLHKPPRNPIVFVGSSSFRMWKDVHKAFPDRVIINRGFGGSSLPHVIEYAEEIIIPYKPKQVVVYCGENDFMTDTVTSEIVVDRFVTLFDLLRREIPRAEIVFVAMKPSPSRQRLWPRIAAANEAIKKYLEKKPRTAFVDIWSAMLTAEGEPRKELFLNDMLHMNQEGYAIWQEALAPYLK